MNKFAEQKVIPRPDLGEGICCILSNGVMYYFREGEKIAELPWKPMGDRMFEKELAAIKGAP